MKLNIWAGAHNKGIKMSSLNLTWQVTGNQWSANVWEEMNMTLAETFRTDARKRAEEPWGRTRDYSNQTKKHLRH